MQQPLHSIMAANTTLLLKQVALARVRGKTPQQRRTIIGEDLLRIILPSQPRLARKITGMLLEMTDMDPLVLLYDSRALTYKIKESVAVLKHHQHEQRQKHLNN